MLTKHEYLNTLPECPKHWAVANTQPHREQVAIENLVRQNFEPYCPVVRKTVRHARKSREVLRALFPGYIFVAINVETSPWRSILSTTGVRSLVRFGDRLSFIDEAFIATLKAREIDRVISRPENPHRIGQNVCLSGGPFDGLVAKIIEMDDKNRLVVLLELLKRPVRVTIGIEHVSPV